MKYVVISSNNAGKIAEISAIFQNLSVEVVSFESHKGFPLEIEEDGLTFEENAIKKVLPCPSDSDCLYLGDDSGLSVDALNGAPGIYSARYAGANATVESACTKLLNEMSGVADRRAHFVSSIAVKFPDGRVETVTGKLFGTIATEMTGKNGFGFDPIFIPDGYSVSLAELSPSEKNQISHRFLALTQAREKIFS